MTLLRSVPAAAIVVCLCAAGAGAQSAYVAGSLSADVVRSGSVDGNVSTGTGEAFSFSLRVGAAVTPRFGVELDFTRPSTIEVEETPDVRILTALPLIDIYPPVTSVIGWTIRSEQRMTTVTAAAWAQQEVSSRVSLVYLAGIAFARIDRSVRGSFSFAPTPLPTYETRTVGYDRGPMAGLEVPVRLTEHARLVPGVRLISVADAWIVRPAIALGWRF